MVQKTDLTPTGPEGKGEQPTVQSGQIAHANPNEMLPKPVSYQGAKEQLEVRSGHVSRAGPLEGSAEELELSISPILDAQNFANDNFQLNLEYQRLFYAECLKGERATSWIALALIVISVLLVLGGTITALLLKEPVELLNAASGIFTGILGGFLYDLHVKSRTRLDKAARELSNTAREFSSIGRAAMAKHFIDQLSDPAKRDEQLESLIQHILQPNLGSDDS